MTDRCDRFERDGFRMIPAVAVAGAGPVVDADEVEAAAHLAGCTHCQARRRKLERVIGWLGEAVVAPGPRPGWEEAVLARARAASPAARRRRVAWWAAGGSLAAVAAAAVLLVVGRGPTPAPPWSAVAQLEIVHDPSLRFRAAAPGAGEAPAAVPGDAARIRFATGGAAVVDLRVFRGDELVFRCPGQGCRVSGGFLEALVPLPLAGRYEPLLIWSATPLPAAAAGAIADSARLMEGGARVQAMGPITVR